MTRKNELVGVDGTGGSRCGRPFCLSRWAGTRHCPYDNTDLFKQSLKLSQKRYEVCLLFLCKLKFENQVEKFHRILQGEQPVIVEIGWRVLDAAQREGFDGAISTRHAPVDH